MRVGFLPLLDAIADRMPLECCVSHRANSAGVALTGSQFLNFLTQIIPLFEKAIEIITVK